MSDSEIMTSIAKVLAELLGLDEDFAQRWAKAKAIKEEEVIVAEKKLGYKLPTGFRRYLLTYGLGGPLLREDIDHNVLSSLNMSDRVLNLAREDFSYERTFVEIDNGKRKQSIKKVVRGADETNGTLLLGCPTGTHVYFHLVLKGKYAGEVWKGHWSLAPSSKPDFLQMTLAYLSKELRAAKKRAKCRQNLVGGKSLSLLDAKSGSTRKKLMTEFQRAARDVATDPHSTVSHYATVLDALAHLDIDASGRSAFLLLLKRYDEAEHLALEAIADPKTFEYNRPTHNVNLLLACAGQEKEIPPDLTYPTTYYGYSFCSNRLLKRIYATLTTSAKIRVVEELSDEWGIFLRG